MGVLTEYYSFLKAGWKEYVDVEKHINNNFDLADNLFHAQSEELKKKEPIINKKSGFNLDITDRKDLNDSNKVVSAKALKEVNEEALKIATTTNSGRVKIGKNLTIKSDGTLDAKDQGVDLGTTSGTALEGSKLAEILGASYGGNIQDTIQKINGKIYLDTNISKLFRCIKDGDSTIVNNSDEYFEDITNLNLLPKSGGTMTGEIIMGGNDLRGTGEAGIRIGNHDAITFLSNSEHIKFNNALVNKDKVNCYHFGNSTGDHGIDQGTIYAKDIIASGESLLNAGSSFENNGYQKLPSGLIIQWGNNTMIYGQKYVDVTFPISFPNNALLVIGSDSNASDGAVTSFAFKVINQSTFTAYQATTYSYDFAWMAIGY